MDKREKFFEFVRTIPCLPGDSLFCIARDGRIKEKKGAVHGITLDEEWNWGILMEGYTKPQLPDSNQFCCISRESAYIYRSNMIIKYAILNPVESGNLAVNNTHYSTTSMGYFDTSKMDINDSFVSAIIKDNPSDIVKKDTVICLKPSAVGVRLSFIINDNFTYSPIDLRVLNSYGKEEINEIFK